MFRAFALAFLLLAAVPAVAGGPDDPDSYLVPCADVVGSVDAATCALRADIFLDAWRGAHAGDRSSQIALAEIFATQEPDYTPVLTSNFIESCAWALVAVYSDAATVRPLDLRRAADFCYLLPVSAYAAARRRAASLLAGLPRAPS